jgi:hypothetical protein
VPRWDWQVVQDSRPAGVSVVVTDDIEASFGQRFTEGGGPVDELATESGQQEHDRVYCLSDRLITQL